MASSGRCLDMEKSPSEHSFVCLSGDPTKLGKKAISDENIQDLKKILLDFLNWEPYVPTDPRSLAKLIAPLGSLLKSEVENALKNPLSALTKLSQDWKNFLSPEFDNERFADAYAQTVTYSLLLARLSGAENLIPKFASDSLSKNNEVLAKALEILGEEGAQKELSLSFSLLQRVLAALKPDQFKSSKSDLWLYFYEDFLAEYDPELRKEFGVYYTPQEIVKLQVSLASELLDKKFNKKIGFASDGVAFIDPATGTGTYLLEAIRQGLQKVKTRFGAGQIPIRASYMAQNAYGFEVLVGPYAVTRLRLTQTIENAINDNNKSNQEYKKFNDKLNIFLSDTLESPNKSPLGSLPFFLELLTDELENARKVKNNSKILVCIGNPPYNRHQSNDSSVSEEEDKKKNGGWVRHGDSVSVKAGTQTPILEDFIEPARNTNAGVHVKNLYNDYVYFWRWSLWKLYEQQEEGGIVTFITPSSYLLGPGFVGMREFMRKTFDEFWVLDLGGSSLGTRKSPNVFNIQTAVAIAIGVRGTGEIS